MSSSRIIQISDEPIDKDDYIEENEFYENWFVGAIADYVSDLDVEESVSDWLNSDIYDVADNTITIKDKGTYFKPRFERFKTECERAMSMSFDDFSDYSSDIYNLKESYDDKYGIYFYYGDELWTQSRFLRNFKNGEKFYTGGMIRYHY